MKASQRVSIHHKPYCLQLAIWIWICFWCWIWWMRYPIAYSVFEICFSSSLIQTAARYSLLRSELPIRELLSCCFGSFGGLWLRQMERIANWTSDTSRVALWLQLTSSSWVLKSVLRQTSQVGWNIADVEQMSLSVIYLEMRAKIVNCSMCLHGIHRWMNSSSHSSASCFFLISFPWLCSKSADFWSMLRSERSKSVQTEKLASLDYSVSICSWISSCYAPSFDLE